MKNKGTAIILCLFLGGLGVHRFYLDRKDGLLYLLFCWTLIPALVAFIEFFVFIFMSQRTFDAVYNNGQSKGGLNAEKAEVLMELHALKEKGGMTEDEFDEAKRRLFR